MKKATIILFVYILSLIGCQEESFDRNQRMGNYYVSVETFEKQTRTALSDDRSIVWSAEDHIAIFEGNKKGQAYKILDSYIGKNYGEFTPVQDVTIDGPESHIDGVIAVYPLSSDLSISSSDSGYEISGISFPSNQKYTVNSFTDHTFPMAALDIDETDNLSFKNIGGLLKLRLKGNNSVSRITLTGNSNELLSGQAIISLDVNGIPYVKMSANADQAVTIECDPAVQLNNEEATNFYISIPPTDFKAGFTVTITDIKGVNTIKTTSKRNKTERSKILSMPEVTIGDSVENPDNPGNPGMPVNPDEVDYIDEYGINHGPGIRLGATVWAPVNCGYHNNDFKFGKLYQWGRKYGQGYSGSLYDSQGSLVGTYSDASLPELGECGVPASIANNEENANIFYIGANDSFSDWISSRDDRLWNSNTETNPCKTANDPCPPNWRIPTLSEFESLTSNVSQWTEQSGQMGLLFSSSNTQSDLVSHLFLPAAGDRGYDGENCYGRLYSGSYWNSHAELNYLFFNKWGENIMSARRAYGNSVRCVLDGRGLMSGVSINLDKTNLHLEVGSTYPLSVTILPSGVANYSAEWWSDDPSIATVDENGQVTAVSEGKTTITVMVGALSATCSIIVKNLKDYFDEYGVNHGTGTEIDGIVWAPVNCGYHKDDFLYGKLYQWGRKYGQGYSGIFINLDYSNGTYSDASVPFIIRGPVSLDTGQSKSNENRFYKDSSNPSDWVSPHKGDLWNSGNYDDPVKGEYDPCPYGWRVPTNDELKGVSINYSSKSINNGVIGYWLSGSQPYSIYATQVFFPAGGGRSDDGRTYQRGEWGEYWSSNCNDDYHYSYSLILHSDSNVVNGSPRAYGCSVRCVQE